MLKAVGVVVVVTVIVIVVVVIVVVVVVDVIIVGKVTELRWHHCLHRLRVDVCFDC